jgi:hypothetical protein
MTRNEDDYAPDDEVAAAEQIQNAPPLAPPADIRTRLADSYYEYRIERWGQFRETVWLGPPERL